MGPNVQRNTTRNYVQLFDAKGHPQNLDSETSMRRLIRAQNDALSTVGVVVRRASMNRSPWQTMSDEQKHLLLLDENVAGANYGLVESLLQGLATRWIVTLRRRILTYKSYVGLSVPQMILSEWNILGPRTFLLAGLPSAAIAGISHSLRDDILDDARSLSLLRPTSRLHLASIARVVRTQRLACYPVFIPRTNFGQSSNTLVRNRIPLLCLFRFTIAVPYSSQRYATCAGSCPLFCWIAYSASQCFA